MISNSSCLWSLSINSDSVNLEHSSRKLEIVWLMISSLDTIYTTFRGDYTKFLFKSKERKWLYVNGEKILKILAEIYAEQEQLQIQKISIERRDNKWKTQLEELYFGQ